MSKFFSRKLVEAFDLVFLIVFCSISFFFLGTEFSWALAQSTSCLKNIYQLQSWINQELMIFELIKKESKA